MRRGGRQAQERGVDEKYREFLYVVLAVLLYPPRAGWTQVETIVKVQGGPGSSAGLAGLNTVLVAGFFRLSSVTMLRLVVLVLFVPFIGFVFRDQGVFRDLVYAGSFKWLTLLLSALPAGSFPKGLSARKKRAQPQGKTRGDEVSCDAGRTLGTYCRANRVRSRVRSQGPRVWRVGWANYKCSRKTGQRRVRMGMWREVEGGANGLGRRAVSRNKKKRKKMKTRGKRLQRMFKGQQRERKRYGNGVVA